MDRLETIGGAVISDPGVNEPFGTEVLVIGTVFEVVGREEAELIVDRQPRALEAAASRGIPERMTSPLDLLVPDD